MAGKYQTAGQSVEPSLSLFSKTHHPLSQASDEHAYSQGYEGDESLGSGTNIVRSPFVDVYNWRKEEEVVANAVKKDAKESECLSIGSRVGEENIKPVTKPKRASQSKESFELRIF